MAIFDGGRQSSDGPRNSGYGLRVHDGQLTILLAQELRTTCGGKVESRFPPINGFMWPHPFKQCRFTLCKRSLIYDDNTIPLDPINFDGLDYDHNRYQIGLLDPNGLNRPHFDFMGRIRNVGVWAKACQAAKSRSSPLWIRQYPLGSLATGPLTKAWAKRT